VLFSVRVRIGVSVLSGVPIGVSVLARHLVGRASVLLLGRGGATPRRRGQHGSEQHEHCEDGRQDSLHACSHSGLRRSPASALTREAVKALLAPRRGYRYNGVEITLP
jgi:hypothetical protein